MLRTYVLFGIAAAGLGFGIYMSQRTNAPVLAAPPASPPAASPFGETIAGAGIVEARSENIAIGNPVPGVVSKVHVRVGQSVKTNDPLFEIDARALRAELGVKSAALAAARAKVERLEKQPRPEEVNPARARVTAAEAAYADANAQFSSAEKVSIPGALSPEELTRRRNAMESAKARLTEAKAQLDWLLAGAWAPDLAVARAEEAMAKAEAERLDIEIERLVVRAPIDATILKVNVRPGEFAPGEVLSNPLLVLGDTSRLHVRVDIDESDVWRFRADLRFERIEPYVIPKRSLTGDSSERVDTRVLQALYSLDRGALPVHVGVQVDVFLDASSGATASAPASARTDSAEDK
jgi:multidrug efflux pump subunit AcrA (membrane-fusion protein)